MKIKQEFEAGLMNTPLQTQIIQKIKVHLIYHQFIEKSILFSISAAISSF